MNKQILFVVYLILVTSCSSVAITEEPSIPTAKPVSPTSPVTSSSDFCLPPLENFAFPIGDTDIRPPKQEPKLPSQEWKRVSRVPGAYNNGAFQTIELLLVRTWHTKTEVWARGNKGELLRYDIQADKWQALDQPTSTFLKLFLDHENRLWAARADSSIMTRLPLFMRYDDDQHRFIETDTDFNDKGALRAAILQLDNTGLTWIIMVDENPVDGQKYKLYSLDLTTLELKYHSLERNDILPALTILPDGNLILLARQSNKYSDRSTVLMYLPETSQVQEIPIPPSIYNYDGFDYEPLFLDSSKRVWLSYHGWVDLSEWEKGSYQWFEVVRPPVFIGMFIANPSWSWGEPYFTYETSDGRLWYGAPRGTGWVDPELGEWCVFTSYRSNVLADDKKNLWIIVDGWLYVNSDYSDQ